MVGIRDQVLTFFGVGLEVEQLLVDGLLGGVSDVLPLRSADGLAGGNREARGVGGIAVFVKEFAAPGDFGIGNDGGEVAALHPGSGRQTGDLEQGGGNVDVESDLLAATATLAGGQAGVADDEGDADGLFVRDPLTPEAVGAAQGAVVGGEDDDRVLIPAGLAKGFHDAADGGVDAGDEVVAGADVVEKLLFGVAGPLAIFGAVERLAEKGGKLFEGLTGIGIRGLDGGVFVAVGPVRIHVVPRSVGFFEIERDAERFGGRGGGEELDGFVGDQRGEVADGAIDGLFEIDRLREAKPVVELGFGQGEGFALPGGIANGVLAEEGGAVAFAAEDGGVSFGELRGSERGQEIGDPVAAHVLAGEDGGATAAADRRGDEVVPEQNAVFGELIDVGRFDDGVAVTAEVVEPLVVGLDEEDVGTVGLGG